MSNIITMPKAKLGKQGWMVQLQPGPLADALAHLSGQPMLDTNDLALIPYTRQLDQYIVGLVDALISLRYDANRVALTLFDAVNDEVRDDN